jgi:heterodisulfide reductase subunit A-like polyferredoxin
VVVVGGGLAGLSAAIEAYHAGGTVILLDKAKNVGGNSAKVRLFFFIQSSAKQLQCKCQLS